ncbi:MAG TPA: pyridoxal phosphate-dependent aminotransferase [Rubricoccaceae bacterium]|nr:pyridoxal phosphate-dependent aminotransferase [Rubricoccaceae bacterium]
MPTAYALDDLNPNVAAMRPSATLAVSARAKALVRAGHDVVDLSAGEPDFDTPAPIVEAAHEALRQGFTHYTPNAGIPELREAVAAKLHRENALDVKPAQVLCTNGTKQALAMAVLALCRPGDEVIVPAPYWVSYPEMVRLAGAEPVFIETTAEGEYKLTAEALEAAITERTRLVFLCYPSNPTGAVLEPPELEELAAVLRRHEHVFVISDEIYEHVIFDSAFRSFATFDGMADRTVTVNGFAKAYAMTGWRLGYLAGPRWIVDAADTIQSNFSSAPNSIAQKAGVAALGMGLEEVQRMTAAFRRRRDFLLDKVQALPGVRCPKPEGAFYLFPDVSAYYGRTAPDGTRLDGSEALCLYLLDACEVALVPGAAFGADAGVRVSYAADMDTLARAMQRIEKCLASLR